MAVFDWAETNATSMSAAARVRALSLGDGYEQRSPDGLNPVRQVWSLSFEGCDNAVANDIDAFLRTHAGATAFDWTPPYATTALRFTCASWGRALATQSTCNMTAEFRQVFEP